MAYATTFHCIDLSFIAKAGRDIVAWLVKPPFTWPCACVQIMADRGASRGDRGRGDRGDRGRGRGPRRPRGKKDDEEKWVPCTKLGRLVQQVGS